MSIISKCPKCQQPVTIPDGVEPEIEVRCPLCVVVYPLGEAIAELPPALIPVETEPPDAEGAGLDAGQDVDAAPQTAPPATDEATPAIDTGHTPVDAGVFSGFRLQEEGPSPDERVGATPSKRRRRKKKKKSSAVKEMVGAILGGFLGLAIGYYMLNYLGGERFDFMEIYLPGVPHTYQYRATSDEDQVLCPTTPNHNLARPALTKRTPASPR